MAWPMGKKEGVTLDHRLKGGISGVDTLDAGGAARSGMAGWHQAFLNTDRAFLSRMAKAQFSHKMRELRSG